MEQKSPTAASLPRSGPQPLDLDASSPGDALALRPGDLLEDGSGFGSVISILWSHQYWVCEAPGDQSIP